MNYKEIKMNKMNQLIALMDEIYGFDDKVGNSKVRVIDHKYNKQKNLYTTTLQFHTRRKGQIVSNTIKENSLLSAILK